MHAIREISDIDFGVEVLNSETPVLVEFFAPWCVPCKQVSIILNDIVTRFNGRLKICKFNVDEANTPVRYSISTVPTLLLFNKGEVIDSIFGLKSRDEIEQTCLSNL